MNLSPRRPGRAPYRLYALLNKIRDRLGVAQAMRMMGVTFLDHHRDASAELLIDGLDGGSILAEERIYGAADLKNRHIGQRQVFQPLKSLAFHPWIVGIDAGDLVGIGGAPAKFEYSAPAHADERGFFDNPYRPVR